jgi:hypothetical protein
MFTRSPMINHGVCAFIENKRYLKEQTRIGDVVNPKAAAVYQTDAFRNLNGACSGALSARQRRNSAEYVDDQKYLPRACRQRIATWRQFLAGLRDR